MKTNLLLITIFSMLLMTYCTESISKLESVEGIEFEMMEVSTDFFKENAPKELILSVRYEKEDTTGQEEEDVFAKMDRILSDQLNSEAVEFMIEIIDTTIF